MMGKIIFLKYQRDWIKNPNQFAIGEKSRRIGLTFSEAYRVTGDLSTNKVKNGKVWFSSADLSASEEFIDYVGYFARYLNAAAKYVGEVVIDKEDDIRLIVYVSATATNVMQSLQIQHAFVLKAAMLFSMNLLITRTRKKCSRLPNLL